MEFMNINVVIFQNGYPNIQMQSHHVQHFFDYIDNLIENMAEGLPIPQFTRMSLENGLLKVSCSDDVSLMFLVSVINDWPDQSMNIVFAENIPSQYFTITIPETGLNSATVLTQLAVSNSEIEFCRWIILEMVEELNVTNLTFLADSASFLNVQNNDLVLRFRDYLIDVNPFDVE